MTHPLLRKPDPLTADECREIGYSDADAEALAFLEACDPDGAVTLLDEIETRLRAEIIAELREAERILAALNRSMDRAVESGRVDGPALAAMDAAATLVALYEAKVERCRARLAPPSP